MKHVVISFIQGIVDDVKVFSTEEKAIKEWETMTNVSWQEYEDSGCDHELFFPQGCMYLIHQAEEDEGHSRICNTCGKENFLEGFCIDSGIEYYCSDKCLFTVYTKEEWEEMYCDGGDSYWTQWDD